MSFLSVLKELLQLNELHSKGLVATKLRPKPEHTGIVAENIKASWSEVL